MIEAWPIELRIRWLTSINKRYNEAVYAETVV